MPQTQPNLLNRSSELGAQLKTLIARAEETLVRSLPPEDTAPVELHRAMRYAVLGGTTRPDILVVTGNGDLQREAFYLTAALEAGAHALGLLLHHGLRRDHVHQFR